jgi:hypothetical protein
MKGISNERRWAGQGAKKKRSPGEKSVKREARHKHAIDELGHTRKDEEDEEGIDEF